MSRKSMTRKTATPFDVNGRTVFITGAARGIGAETARRLYAKGANVALVGLEPERLEELAAQLGERAVSFEVDVTDYDALQRAVRGTIERFGALDVAIANAGVQFNGALATAPIEQIERTLAVNLLGVWRTDRAVIEHITARRGYLLNISSLSAIAHAPLLGAYSTAKAGVEALSDALRLESIPSGARVGCAYFGFIDTDLVRGGFAGPSGQAARNQMPGFISKPAPLAKAIDAIEDGIERRAARIWAPRWLGPMLVLRGIVQPIMELGVGRDPGPLAESMRLAESSTGEVPEPDPLLGVAAVAIEPTP
jgi:NAD(P)-dependent dehydrogenase (short-subunit alcohol dehydrogenase family)